MENLSTWLKRGDWPQISEFLSNLAEHNYDSEAFFAKGLLLVYGPKEQRDVDLALSLLQKTCAIAPDNFRYLNTYSEVLLQARQATKALEVALQCTERFPNNAMSAIALGRAAWECKNRQVAYGSYQSALKLLPKDQVLVRDQVSKMLLKLAPLWWNPLAGRSIKLVRKGLQHSDFLIACRQDKAFHHHFNLFQEPTPQAVKKELKNADRSPLESRKIEWVVEKNGEPIGLAALVDLNFNNSRAELLIGFPGEVSSLVTVEATILVLEFAFSTLGLFKLYSYVYSDNPVGQKNTLRLGFEQEGLLRSHVQDPSLKERLDLYLYGCLQQDFFGNTALMKMAMRLLGRFPLQKEVEGTITFPS